VSGAEPRIARTIATVHARLQAVLGGAGFGTARGSSGGGVELQATFAHASYADAKRARQRPGRDLQRPDDFAAASLAEDLEATRASHALANLSAVGTSCKRASLTERSTPRVEAPTRRVARWRTSKRDALLDVPVRQNRRPSVLARS